MHTLPKRALAVACAAALLGTGTSALAAESVPASAPSTGISVQLDGRNLSFPDAAPEARDGRTFLPVRTVFEAMGAEVSYSPAAQTITAVRDGTTVTMTVQNILDQLCPGLLALGLTLLMVRLLNKKINPVWLIFALFALGIIGNALGFLS